MTTTSTAPQVSTITQIRALNDRLIKAESIVSANKVHPVINMPDHYVVEGNAGFYIVNGTCCCNDAASRNDLIKGHCKHKLAALPYAEQQKKAETSTPQAVHKPKAESPQGEELERKVSDLY
jgi:hypothetical protein